MTLIGITGLPGSRKTDFAEHLSEHGYHCVSMSQIVRETSPSAPATAGRSELWVAGLAARAAEGPSAIAARVWAAIEAGTRCHPRFVVDGIRSLYEASYFAQRSLFTLVAVQASPVLRHARLRDRAFSETPGKVFTLDAHELRLGTAEAVAMSDHVVAYGRPDQIQNVFVTAAADIHAAVQRDRTRLLDCLERYGSSAPHLAALLDEAAARGGLDRHR